LLSKTELTRLQQRLTEYDRSREKLLELTRKTTRLASWAIIQTHREQISKAKINILNAQTDTSKEGIANFYFTIMVASSDQLRNIMNDIRRVKKVTDVKRVVRTD